MNYYDYEKISPYTLGQKKAELVLKNASVANVFTGEFLETSVAVQNGIIVGIGDYSGKTEIDIRGQYLLPGFIDAYVHSKPNLASLKELIHVAAFHGTTTFFVDPYEVINVAGISGIDSILQQTADVPANVYVMLPFCEPLTPANSHWRNLTPEAMLSYMNNPRIVKTQEFLDSDHSSLNFEHALREVRNGVHIHIREGSLARNEYFIVRGIVKNQIDTSLFSFCTDKKLVSDIIKEGHINYSVRLGVALGLKPIQAVQMATINAARHYGLHHLGAISVGYQADLVVVDSLVDFHIEQSYHKGKRIDKEKEH